jgi:hypothetical protein
MEKHPPSCAVLVVVWALAAFVAPPPVAAASISYTDDFREIQAQGVCFRMCFPYLPPGSPDMTVFQNFTVQPSPLFSHFSVGRRAIDGYAGQVSDLGSESLYASGSAVGFQDAFSNGNGRSTFHIFFEVTEATEWLLTGELFAGELIPDGLVSTVLRLSATSGDLFTASLISGLGDPASMLPIDEGGILTPGIYELIAESTATNGTASYDMPP